MSDWPLPYDREARDVALTAFLTPAAASSHAQPPDGLVKQEFEAVSELRPAGPDGWAVAPPALLQQRAPFLPAFADVLRSTTPHRGNKQPCQREPNASHALETQHSPGTGKSSLDFILGGDQQRVGPSAAPADRYRTPEPATPVSMSSGSAGYYSLPSTSQTGFVSAGGVLPSLASQGLQVSPSAATTSATALTTPRRGAVAVANRPASRTCKFAGCTHYVVDHGLCVRHGGGKRCTTEGCTSRAKHFGRCWRHGGSMECKTPGCVNRAKSRGYCWSHGGGTKCKAQSCNKIAISNGLCWAHGGGKRCIVAGCQKQAYERTRNYCNSHFQQLKQTQVPAHEA